MQFELLTPSDPVNYQSHFLLGEFVLLYGMVLDSLTKFL
jgi:hypothetical protein